MGHRGRGKLVPDQASKEKGLHPLMSTHKRRGGKPETQWSDYQTAWKRKKGKFKRKKTLFQRSGTPWGGGGGVGGGKRKKGKQGKKRCKSRCAREHRQKKFKKKTHQLSGNIAGKRVRWVQTRGGDFVKFEVG